MNAVEYDLDKDGSVIEFDHLEFGYSASDTKEEDSSNGEGEEGDVAGTTKRPILRGTKFTTPQGRIVDIVGSPWQEHINMHALSVLVYNYPAERSNVYHWHVP